MFAKKHAVDILIEIATDLQRRQGKMNIFDLKYEVTQCFFEGIEISFSGFYFQFSLDSVVVNRELDFKTMNNAYRNYQNEVM